MTHLATRYEMMPARKSGRYYARDAMGKLPAIGIQIDNAEHRPTSQQMLQSGVIALEEETCVWCLWKRMLGTIEPRQGDKWIDGTTGIAWHVRRVDVELLGQRYRLLCVRGAEESRES